MSEYIITIEDWFFRYAHERYTHFFGCPIEEIVRCRDCKHSIHFFHHDDERWQCTEPYQEGDNVKPDAYCWRGERKEGGDA